MYSETQKWGEGWGREDVAVVYFEPWSIGAVGKIVTGIQK